MICYRSSQKKGGIDYAPSYTVTVDNVLQKSSCYQMFINNSTFNEPVTIGNNVNNVSYMFDNCSLYNQSTVIPEGITSCRGMFYYCSSFNQTVEIPSTVTDCAFMFSDCSQFNQPVTIPSGVINATGMFQSSGINQDIVVPASVTAFRQVFSECNNFEKNIYFKGTSYRALEVNFLFASCTNEKRKNVWFNSALNNIFNTNALIGQTVTWTDMTNGFYNSDYNVYCYYNYGG